MTNVVQLGLLVLAFTGAVAFIGLYTWWVDWWTSEIGWHMVTFAAVLLILSGNALAFRIFGDYPGRQPVNIAVFTVWVAAQWWRNAMVIRENRGRKGGW